MRIVTTAALATAIAAWAGAASALTPISGFVQAQADVFMADGAVTDSDTQTFSWANTPASGAVAFLSAASVPGPTANAARANALVDGQWSADGLSGRVEFDWGWAFRDEADGLMGASFTSLNPNWSYTFQADNDGLLRWEGQIQPGFPGPVATDNRFGLSGWNLQINGVTVIDLFDPTGGSGPRTGDGDFALVAGETYTLSLTNFSNITSRTFGPSYGGRLLGDFFWDIVETPTTTVPEPGAWTLMILGFGLAGAGLRTGSGRRAAERTR